MTEKVYKGQSQVVDGSFVGEAITTVKFAYDSNFQIQYMGEVKVGVDDDQNRHYINRFEYDPITFVVTKITTAQNIARTGATSVSITSHNINEVRIDCAGADFSDIHAKDEIYINTPLNVGKRTEIVKKLSNTSLIVSKLDLVPEGPAAVGLWDVVVTLKHDSTMDYAKRRWDKRSLYTYA